MSPLLFPVEHDAPFRARVRAGVDEAGFGPLLGPLTIGWSAFAAEDSRCDPWRELRAVVSRAPADDERRLVVADSKVVFTRNPRGERRLERTSLAFLALLHPQRRWPASGCELLESVQRDVQPAVPLDEEPWFPFLAGRLPRCADEAELREDVDLLASAAEQRGIHLVELGARVLGVRELNDSFAATGSKSRTHWDLSAPVIERLWREHARAGLDVLVDRHGGRKRYGALLRGSLPDAAVSTLVEAPARSDYAVVSRDGGRSMRVAFAEKADGASFAVALASCLAKYTRETCMHAFNAHWCSLEPTLRPTAGYFLDGRRWLAEARATIERSGRPARDLVRER